MIKGDMPLKDLVIIHTYIAPKVDPNHLALIARLKPCPRPVVGFIQGPLETL